MSKKVKLQGSINVVFEVESELHSHTYLLDSVLIDSLELVATTVSGDRVILNTLDWTVLLNEDGELE